MRAGGGAAPFLSLCTTKRDIHWGPLNLGSGGLLHVDRLSAHGGEGTELSPGQEVMTHTHVSTPPPLEDTPVPCTGDRPRGGVHPLSFLVLLLTKGHLKSLDNSSRGKGMGFKT